MNLVKSNDFLTILPALIPAVGGLCVLLAQITLPRFRSLVSFWLTLSFLFIALVVVGLSLGWGEGFFAAFMSLDMIVPASYEDQLAFGGQINWSRYEALYSFATLAFIMVIVLMSKKVFVRLNLDLVEVYQMMLFSGSGLILLICSNNLIMLFLALELSSLPIFVLAGWDRKLKSCNEAGIKYFLLNAFSVAFLLLGIAFVYGVCGSVDLDLIPERSRQAFRFGADSYLRGGIVLMLVGLCFKAALFPLHAWVADVYEGSLTVVTAFMASLVKIASFAVLFKILAAFSGFILHESHQTSFPLSSILVALAVASMFYGNITALAQKNLKRLFAYSSIAHAGYMAALLPLAYSSEYSKEASDVLFFYVVSYALASTLSFGVIAFLELPPEPSRGSKKSKEGKNKQIEWDHLKGLSERHPYASFLLCVSALSFAGIPPLVGFYGKFYILKILLSAKMYALAIILSINSLIAVFYYARVFFYSYWFSDDGNKTKEPRALFPSPVSWIPMTILGLLTILLGIFSTSFINGLIK